MKSDSSSKTPIPDAIETGTDNLFAHGIPLFPMTIGYEVKDAAYFAKVIHLSDGLPMVLSDPLSHLADYLEQNKYSNFFSPRCVSPRRANVS